MVASAIHFDPMTGTPSAVASAMRRRVSAYTRENLGRGFKIGITKDPESRFARGYADYYDEMIVLYTEFVP